MLRWIRVPKRVDPGEVRRVVQLLLCHLLRQQLRGGCGGLDSGARGGGAGMGGGGGGTSRSRSCIRSLSVRPTPGGGGARSGGGVPCSARYASKDFR